MVRIAGQVGPTMVDFKCAHCGKNGQRKKGSESSRMFCSQKCYLASDYHRQSVAAANAARRADVWVTKPCASCGVDVRRHTSRQPSRFFCSRECRVKDQRKGNPIHVTSSGYVLVYVGRDYPGATRTGHVLEHRKVMQDILGRPLLPEENVHHVNGVRDDNRPENLELWSVSQPKGQRVEDKLRWAREFLAFYEREGPSDGQTQA